MLSRLAYIDDHLPTSGHEENRRTLGSRLKLFRLGGIPYVSLFRSGTPSRQRF